jgi:hypothetical protein
MAIMVQDREVTRVAIVDDQPESREGYGYIVENADLVPIDESGPLGSLQEYLDGQITNRADAGICDFQLSGKKYANFSGAALVAGLYKAEFPALLCTRWEKAQLAHITPYRRWIPVLLPPLDLNEESLVRGIEECLKEFAGKFHAFRRPWRAQVHFLFVDEGDPDSVFAEVPGWEIDEIVKLSIRALPEPVVANGLQDVRLRAQVNLGAGSLEELYLCDWEV